MERARADENIIAKSFIRHRALGAAAVCVYVSYVERSACGNPLAGESHLYARADIVRVRELRVYAGPGADIPRDRRIPGRNRDAFRGFFLSSPSVLRRDGGARMARASISDNFDVLINGGVRTRGNRDGEIATRARARAREIPSPDYILDLLNRTFALSRSRSLREFFARFHAFVESELYARAYKLLDICFI